MGKNSKKRRSGRRTAAAIIGIALLSLGCVTAGLKLFSMHPYEVTVNGKSICYLKDNKDAEQVMGSLAELLVPDGAEIKIVKANDGLQVGQADGIIVKQSDILSPEDAAEKISEALKDIKDDKVEVTTVSTKLEVITFTPEVKYEKDETRLAGDKEIVEEGRDGKEERLMSYTSVNGKIVDEEILESQILDKGKHEVIRKGTLGLPEGEDWRTYEGDPVYRDGNDLVATSLNYLGAPYKYGGSNLETGIDCVWFVVRMYEKYGIKLPAGHKGLQNVGIAVSLADAQKGDIVCYKNHVGIYAGDGKMVEAVRKGVRVGKINTSKLVTIRRVVH